MPPLEILAAYTTYGAPGSDNTMDVIVNSANQDDIVFGHTRLLYQLRLSVARLREEIGRIEEDAGHSQFRVDQLEELLGFFR